MFRAAAAFALAPERNDCQHKKLEEAGMDAGRLDLAVKSAIANENPLTKDSTIPALNDVVGKIIASIEPPTQNDAAAR